MLFPGFWLGIPMYNHYGLWGDVVKSYNDISCTKGQLNAPQWSAQKLGCFYLPLLREYSLFEARRKKTDLKVFVTDCVKYGTHL